MAKNYRAELVGAFGDPIDENPTGVMEEAAFAAKGLHYRYLTIKVRKGDLPSAIQAVRALNMRGVNLTIPHKVAVLPYLDELSQAASIIGAVNMVVNTGGKLWGDNTDGKGFFTALTQAGVAVAGKRLTVLGAGGAARAICVECALAGAKHIAVASRQQAQGEELVQMIGGRTAATAEFVLWKSGLAIPPDTDILVNATPVGLFPNVNDKPDIDYDTVGPKMAVSDVIFNPPNTPFLRLARERGAKTINGLGMLVNQGALNFTLWTGVEAPIDVMTDALRKEFGLGPKE